MLNAQAFHMHSHLNNDYEWRMSPKCRGLDPQTRLFTPTARTMASAKRCTGRLSLRLSCALPSLLSIRCRDENHGQHEANVKNNKEYAAGRFLKKRISKPKIVNIFTHNSQIHKFKVMKILENNVKFGNIA